MLIFFILPFLPLVVSQAGGKRDQPNRINIGNFRFPQNDPSITQRVETIENNITAWENFYDPALQLWYFHLKQTKVVPEWELETELEGYANQSAMKSEEYKILLRESSEAYSVSLNKSGDDPQALWEHSRENLLDKVLDRVEEEFGFMDIAWLTAYSGVGAPVGCSPHIDRMLKEATEWNKAGMAAATTLMALMPTFLAFGHLFVPRSSEAFATSWLIGLGAAFFSLGLPVKSLSCIRRKQIIELSTLDKDPLETIADMGDRDTTTSHQDSTGTDNPKYNLADLQEWTRPTHRHKYMGEFFRIKEAVGRYRERWHWWHIPAVLIVAAQGCIFGFAIEPLLRAPGIPRFIFACAERNWTGLYLLVSAVTNALLRLALWQLCDHEIVNIYHLSDTAKDSLESFKKSAKYTTTNQLPPLYPPLVSAFHSRMGRIIQKIFPSYRALRKEHPDGSSSRPLREYLTYFISIIKNPITNLKSGFASTAAAPRWRPLIVLIHLSTQGRPQLRTLFTGFCEVALLLTLTFFFAAQWGGNLYITGIALALILVFITVGRALAIIYVWLSAHTWGLRSINCDEKDEILGCLRIVCSMEGVLVTVNGAYYYDGHRLDYDVDFAKWRLKYANGDFDEKPDGAQVKRSMMKATSPV